MKYTPKELTENVNISHTSPIKEFFLLLGGVLTAILIVYGVLGFAVDLVVFKLPPAIELSIGKLFTQNYANTKKTTAGTQLQVVLDDLLEKHPDGEINYQVHLVPDVNVNAMALPGGNIIVFSGLIKEVESENELSFVLAHELGHFANRDHLRGLGRMLVLLTISTALLGGDNFVNEFLINSLLNVEMKFSQKQEKMADLFALDLLNKKYGQVAGATDFFEKLGNKDQKSRLLYYFATHPHPHDRVKALEKMIKSKGYLLKEKHPLDKAFRDTKG
ncbi:MAG: M48 family metallopeptidase [Deltaproteobacteria bacterium]|nr:M48 family metallopeptidase [Deltaproteobacteria bacterium]